MIQHTSNVKCEKPKPTYHNRNKPRQYKKQSRHLKLENQQSEGNNNSTTNNSGANNFNRNNNKDNKTGRNPKTFHSPYDTCGKKNHVTHICYFGAASLEDPPGRLTLNNMTHTIIWQSVTRPRPNLQSENATSAFRSCNWQTAGHQRSSTSTNPKGSLAATSGNFFGCF